MAEKARFEPRFTLMLLYLALFVVFWGLVMAAPDLLEGWRELAPDADPSEAGREVVREALRGRMPTAVLAALISLGALIWLGVMPGLRRRP